MSGLIWSRVAFELVSTTSNFDKQNFYPCDSTKLPILSFTLIRPFIGLV